MGLDQLILIANLYLVNACNGVEQQGRKGMACEQFDLNSAGRLHKGYGNGRSGQQVMMSLGHGGVTP